MTESIQAPLLSAILKFSDFRIISGIKNLFCHRKYYPAEQFINDNEASSSCQTNLTQPGDNPNR